jgi:predicted CopG family antitoxin
MPKPLKPGIKLVRGQFTTIALPVEVHDELKRMRLGEESYYEVINRLISCYENRHHR